MKKLLIALMSIALFSCSTEETSKSIVPPITVTKYLTYDLEDNMIKIDNVWKHNSNNDQNNWVYYEDFGWRWYEGNLYCYFNKNKYEIVQAELVNYNHPWYLEVDGNDDYFFSSPSFNNWGEDFEMMFYVKITLIQTSN